MIGIADTRQNHTDNRGVPVRVAPNLNEHLLAKGNPKELVTGATVAICVLCPSPAPTWPSGRCRELSLPGKAAGVLLVPADTPGAGGGDCVTTTCSLRDPNDSHTGDGAEWTRSEKRGLTAFFQIIPRFYLSFLYNSILVPSSHPFICP